MVIIKDRKKFPHPDWSYQANIYEVNIRQYTPEGTFNAFAAHLPRLRDMGVKILWFMPVTPISVDGRLGTLGSYYAVQNYKAINPEFGSLDDFKSLVSEAHDLDFKVIVDFVANHTGNDHPWIKEHPEFYCYHPDGTIVHPHGWSDVAQLNFQEKGVWDALTEAMEFWVKECDVDGFRCDMAHLVPLELWYQARLKVEAIKENQFWLAECEVPAYHQVFDATYTWKWMHATEDFYQGRLSLERILMVLYSSDVEFRCGAFRTYFTSNHDENSWNGTEYQKYGDASKLLAVFSCTWDGIPMIYSGQEMPNLKRLKFFEKDPIEWTGTFLLEDFYKILLSLRERNPALRAGDETYTTILSLPHEQRVFAFLRRYDHNEVLVVLNCSPDELHFQVTNVTGHFKNVFGGDDVIFVTDNSLHLLPWGYLVFERIPDSPAAS